MRRFVKNDCLFAVDYPLEHLFLALLMRQKAQKQKGVCRQAGHGQDGNNRRRSGNRNNLALRTEFFNCRFNQ